MGHTNAARATGRVWVYFSGEMDAALLETLRIKNFAIIDEIEVDFHPGFNVLTGETGAGKSIVAGALNLVLGARASSELLREGAERATVEALFRIGKRSSRVQRLLEAQDIPLEDGALLLSRVVTADGRSRAYAGGKMVPVSTLAEIGDELVDLHGQHEHQSLLKTDRQLDLLDGFGETESLTARVGEMVVRLRGLDRDIADLERDDRDRARRVDFLQHELREIDAAQLAPGEDDALKAQLQRITHAETIHALANRVHGALYENEEGAAVDAIDAALRDLRELGRIDPSFDGLADQLAGARGVVESAAMDARSLAEHLEFDPESLDAINARMALIGDLKRKYGASIEEILAYRDAAAVEVDAFARRDERLEALRRDRDALDRDARRAADDLSKQRRTAAKRLDRQVADALQDLGMKGARFQTDFREVALCGDGVDHVEFLLAANAGEKLKPLRQVASGGEISRIMLALKAVFAQADRIPILIFDEIDAGVGGATARKVAAKLAGLAKTHQLICITHMPQIAAAAGAHYQVAKAASKGRTVVRMSEVSREERIQEVARLLDGTLSELSLKHARELLGEK